MRDVLTGTDGVEPDYAVAVDAATLHTPARLSGEVRLLVAATVGPVRLIDNVGLVLEQAENIVEDFSGTLAAEQGEAVGNGRLRGTPWTAA